jgi:2-polyprenyl-3-methyl-5-hydroxy-6-metoxy-1,4-benzoquinol methylase
MNIRAGVAVEQEQYRSQRRADVLRLLPALKHSLKVLEVGCGEGAFSAEIPGETETWGIEPDRHSAAVAQGRLTRVFACTFEECKAELPDRYFDLVVCNDVIEHMIDHDAFLRSIRDHMAPGCYLVGSLPNVRFYRNLFDLIVARDWHYQDSGILDRTHFRFFTLRSVRRSLEGAAFEVKRLEGLNQLHPWGWDLRTVAERLFRHALIFLSAGAARDINFLQIGFLAVPNHSETIESD